MSIFKSERQRRGIDLKEVAKVTRINSFYLRAIEEMDFEHLPVEVYTRSYIKDYARYLAVDPKEILDAYESFLSNKKKERLETPDHTVTSNIPNHKDKVSILKTPDFKLPKAVSEPLVKIGTVLVVMIVVGLAFYWVQSFRFDTYKEVQYNPPLLTQSQNTDQYPSKDTPKEKEGKLYDHTGKNTRPTPTRHNLKITATEKVWLQVVIDGKDTKEIILNPGENLTYTADESVNLLIGNAGGIKIVFDDKVIENLGASGKVVRLKLPQTNSNT